MREDPFLSKKEWPDTSRLSPEDEPFENTFQERQQQLFLDILHTSWPGTRDSPKFLALANVPLFFSLRDPAPVPDLMVSLGVDLLPCEGRPAYFVWDYGKVPELAIEVVCRRYVSKGRYELKRYARMNLPFYVLYDPLRCLSESSLRVFANHGRDYLELLKPGWLKQLNLGLTIWKGSYRGYTAPFLRFCDQEGQLLATAAEKALMDD